MRGWVRQLLLLPYNAHVATCSPSKQAHCSAARQPHLHGVLCARCAEGLAAGEQHVHEHTQAPPVDRAVVAVGEDVFGGDISRSPTERVRSVAIVQDLGKAKVPDLGVAVVIYEDILGLEVAVDYVVVVQVLERKDDAGDVELGQVLIHALHGRHSGSPSSVEIELRLPCEPRSTLPGVVLCKACLQPVRRTERSRPTVPPRATCKPLLIYMAATLRANATTQCAVPGMK